MTSSTNNIEYDVNGIQSGECGIIFSSTITDIVSPLQTGGQSQNLNSMTGSLERGNKGAICEGKKEIKFRDSKPKTQKQCIKCDSPAVVHAFCVDWCQQCYDAPIGEQPATVRLSSGSIVHRAPTPAATKTKIKIIKKKQEKFLESFAGILQQHGMCVGCGNVECCKCN